MKLDVRYIISYAYLTKEVQYITPFAVDEDFYFEGTHVKGFKARNYEHRKNVDVIDYHDDNNFVVRLKMKQPNEELYLIKSVHNLVPQKAAEIVSNTTTAAAMKSTDLFGMPSIELEVVHSYDELCGYYIKSGGLRDFKVVSMMENIKLRIDEVGAKVENQGVIVARMKCCKKADVQPRRFILNRPFWLVMREKDRHPYLVVHIRNITFMHKI